jgi:type VI secretion system protein ImpE
MIPTRYAGTEASSDDQLKLARKTIWEELTDGQYRGLGQRTLTAGDRDFSLLDIRTIEWGASSEAVPT